MIVSKLLFLPHDSLNMIATGGRVNHGGKYELEIPANFHFCVPEKAFKLARK